MSTARNRKISTGDPLDLRQSSNQQWQLLPIEKNQRPNQPQTTITSPTPDYTAGPSPAVEFTSSKSNSTFKCWVDESEPVSCTSPYSPPQNAWTHGQWHIFSAAATDSEGHADSTPAVWTFNTGIYPVAPETSKLTSPEEGRKTGSYLTLKSEWNDPTAGEGDGESVYNAHVKDVSYQLKLPSWNASNRSRRSTCATPKATIRAGLCRSPKTQGSP